jgi:hypothetical protein
MLRFRIDPTFLESHCARSELSAQEKSTVVSRLVQIALTKNDISIDMETTGVKHRKADVRGKARATLEVRFKALNLISYSGLNPLVCERFCREHQVRMVWRDVLSLFMKAGKLLVSWCFPVLREAFEI